MVSDTATAADTLSYYMERLVVLLEKSLVTIPPDDPLWDFHVKTLAAVVSEATAQPTRPLD